MKRKENNHLAEGEVTGHYHQATGQDVEVFEEVFGDESLLLKVPTESTVTHQEHKQITIPAGDYRVGQVLEYDHASEEVNAVRD